MNNILLIDFGSTYTKVTAVDIEQETVIGTARGITTVETDITDGLNQALTSLFLTTGKLEFSKVFGCSSAAGGLKMIAVGLVDELTAEAANRAALGAGAKVLRVFSRELNEYEIKEIAALAPDIILLAGGTDGGNQTVILHNAAMLAALPIDVPIVVAGNKSATPDVVQILRKNMTDVTPTNNVMPRVDELNIEPARQVIRDVFLRRIVKAKDLNKANQLVDRMVMPTPAAVLKAAELLGHGGNYEPGLGDIMVVDIGGATTDVYSIAKGDPTKSSVVLKGLSEPSAKRTVEGDLGMRYSAGALLKAAGTRLIAEYAATSEDNVTQYIEKVERYIEHLPQNALERSLETALGKACARLATDRHAGRLETYFSPHGAAFVQTGKDLTAVATVIGTGGTLINHPRPEEILREMLFNTADPLILKPREPSFLVDERYIMYAMGLLGEEAPDLAVRMMKKYLVRRTQKWS